MSDMVLKADTSKVCEFIKNLETRPDLLKGVTNQFLRSRLSEVLVCERSITTDTGELILTFGVLGTIESFFAPTLGAGDSE